MILITTEEIAVYVKKEIIRDLFADIKKYQCVIDIWLNGKLLPKNIARVSQYFLNETKDQLMDAYNKRFALSFRKREYEIILNTYLMQKYDLKKIEWNVFGADKETYEQKIFNNIDKIKWMKKTYSNSIVYSGIGVYGDKFEISIKNTIKSRKKKGYLLYDEVKKIDLTDCDIQRLLEEIEKTEPRIDRTGCVSVLRPKNARHQKNNKKNSDKDTRRQKKFKEILKEEESITIQISEKYGISYRKIEEIEERYQKSCKYYHFDRQKICSIKECPCTTFLSHCIHRKEFLDEIKKESTKISSNQRKVSAQKDVIWKNVVNKSGLKPGTIEQISRKMKKTCKYYKNRKCTNSVGLQSCSLFSEECICFKDYIEAIEFERKKRETKNKQSNIDTTPSKEIQQPSQPKLHKIGVKDFIVRGNVFRCMHKSHQIQNVDAEVKVSLNNGEDKLFQISAGYCQQCNIYFIMESTYQELKRKGIILCRVTDSKTYAKGGFMNGSKLAQESILMQYGYNVSQTVGLSARQRQKILAVMIDNKVLSKSEIISYLDFFIRQHGSRNNMGVAISKWEDDREFVEHYKSGEYTKFGVNAIYRR